MNMNSVRALSIIGIIGVVTAGLIACQGSSDSSDGNGAEQDLTAVKEDLKGSWTRASGELGGFGSKAIYFSPDGTFFRDRQSIVLGILAPGSNPVRNERDKGTYVIDTKTHTVTLTLAPDPMLPPGSESATFDYTYTPAHIVLGVIAPGPGASPQRPATLALKQRPLDPQFAPPEEHYEHAQSTCQSDTDCTKERTDKTWDPGRAGDPVCKENACSLK
jgi:hypothetical protein